jgi:hypothetical protein
VQNSKTKNAKNAEEKRMATEKKKNLVNEFFLQKINPVKNLTLEAAFRVSPSAWPFKVQGYVKAQMMILHKEDKDS